MKPDLVIFDCDGVLVDSEPPFNAVVSDNLVRYGLTLSHADVVEAFMGKAMPDLIARAREMGADNPAPDSEWIEEIYAEGYARLRDGVDPIPGIFDVLDRLDAAGVPYCVGSNGSQVKMDITLGSTGLAPRFEGARFSAHELGVAKPDPELFLIAAREMGHDPARTVVVEDSATGALAAKRAGMRCFGYAAHDDGAKLAAQGAHLFRDMADLPALLGL
ncbi:HAD-IA family hydrolase [Rhodobacterales bacterium HKCCE4037]|nr:HAD-IA family hydrolase [Rhodobacterales bacterium HKCCE4037]